MRNYLSKVCYGAAAVLFLVGSYFGVKESRHNNIFYHIDEIQKIEQITPLDQEKIEFHRKSIQEICQEAIKEYESLENVINEVSLNHDKI